MRGQPPEHLEAILVHRVDAAAEVIHRVVAAPHDPVVRRESVVVELVGGVADALARAPADPVELLVRQRLGGQHVVVDRNGVQPVPAQQAREHVGGQHHPGRADNPGIGTHPDPAAIGVDRCRRGVLEDLHAVLRTGAGQSEHQPRRVHDRAGVGEQCAQVGRRVHLGANLGLVEQPALALLGCYPQPPQLMRFGGHRQHAGALPLRVHAVFLDVGLHPVQVGQAQLFEPAELVRPARPPVLVAVGDAGLDEAAVPSGRRPAHPFRLDEQHPRAGIAFDRVQRRPQPGVAAAHHEQVTCQRTRQLGVFGPGNVQPHRPELGAGQGLGDQLRIDVGVENGVHESMVPRRRRFTWRTG